MCFDSRSESKLLHTSQFRKRAKAGRLTAASINTCSKENDRIISFVKTLGQCGRSLSDIDLLFEVLYRLTVRPLAIDWDPYVTSTKLGLHVLNLFEILEKKLLLKIEYYSNPRLDYSDDVTDIIADNYGTLEASQMILTVLEVAIDIRVAGDMPNHISSLVKRWTFEHPWKLVKASEFFEDPVRTRFRSRLFASLAELEEFKAQEYMKTIKSLHQFEADGADPNEQPNLISGLEYLKKSEHWLNLYIGKGFSETGASETKPICDEEILRPHVRRAVGRKLSPHWARDFLRQIRLAKQKLEVRNEFLLGNFDKVISKLLGGQLHEYDTGLKQANADVNDRLALLWILLESLCQIESDHVELNNNHSITRLGAQCATVIEIMEATVPREHRTSGSTKQVWLQFQKALLECNKLLDRMATIKDSSHVILIDDRAQRVVTLLLSVVTQSPPCPSELRADVYVNAWVLIYRMLTHCRCEGDSVEDFASDCLISNGAKDGIDGWLNIPGLTMPLRFLHMAHSILGRVGLCRAADGYLLKTILDHVEPHDATPEYRNLLAQCFYCIYQLPKAQKLCTIKHASCYDTCLLGKVHDHGVPGSQLDDRALCLNTERNAIQLLAYATTLRVPDKELLMMVLTHFPVPKEVAARRLLTNADITSENRNSVPHILWRYITGAEPGSNGQSAFQPLLDINDSGVRNELYHMLAKAHAITRRKNIKLRFDSKQIAQFLDQWKHEEEILLADLCYCPTRRTSWSGLAELYSHLVYVFVETEIVPRSCESLPELIFMAQRCFLQAISLPFESEQQHVDDLKEIGYYAKRCIIFCISQRRKSTQRQSVAVKILRR